MEPTFATPLEKELFEALKDVTRILEAFRYTTTLGRNQLERLNNAKTVLAKARSETTTTA